jgi:hypothetical protein
MTKVLTITGNNHITGVEYGVVKIPDTPIHSKHDVHTTRKLSTPVVKQLRTAKTRQK